MGGVVQPWGFCRAGASGEGGEDRGALTFSRILGHSPAPSARNRQLAPLSRKGGEGCEMKWEHSDPWWPVQFSHSVVSKSLWPHESQHARPPCPSPTPRVYSNSCPSSWWCHPAISSSVIPFSSCPQSLPASGSFPMSQLFAWGGQSIGVSALASVSPMNIQDWSPLEWTGCISWQNVVHWRREWQTTSVFFPWEPHEQYEKAKW